MNASQAKKLSNDECVHARRSDCPISYSLDILGDAWSLLIIRDMVYLGKKTFGEFVSSDEGIARNILSSRLARLEQAQIITKRPHPADGRKDIYELTEKGLGLVPILLDIAVWGGRYEPKTNLANAWLDRVDTSRDELIECIQDTVRSGGSIFAGEDSVVAQLQNTKDTEATLLTASAA